MAIRDSVGESVLRLRVRGRNVDDLRRANLSILLRLVHTRGTLTRSELAGITQLNRSTVAILVGELEELGLVTLSAPAPTHRKGRPSPAVTVSQHHVAIGVVPEVDAITVSVVALGGQVLRTVRHEVERIPTPDDAVSTIASILADLEPDLRGHHVLGIGLAVPGLVSADDGVVAFAPGLGWNNVHIASMVSAATGLPVFAGNDADCGVTAEVAYGAAIGGLDVVYLNGGPAGIGAGVTIGGLLLRGHNGFGGELGHTQVRNDGALCRCGASGCIEAYLQQEALMIVSGCSSTDELEDAIAARVPGSDLDHVVQQQSRDLAAALRNIINTFNPETVVLGGYLSCLWKGNRERIAEQVNATALPRAAAAATVVASTLARSENLSLGAADLVFEPYLADPPLVAAAAEGGAETNGEGEAAEAAEAAEAHPSST